MSNEQMNTQEQDLGELLKVRREKLAALQEAGSDPFEITTYDRDTYTTDITDNYEEYEGKTVSVAGRLMSKRVMGKASFSDLRDRYGRIQLYVKRDEVGVEEYQGYKKFDIGDIVGIKGTVFKTHMGEISINVTEITLLSKSLQPLPEKFHGLQDSDLKYRRRYVDLIINPQVRDTFEKRSAIVREIRNFMDGRGFMEVETPILNTIPGGAAARPFITHHNALDIDGVIIVEPRVFEDVRGYFFESFKESEFQENVCRTTFVQDNESKSSYGVLRGLHFQKPPYAQSKLVRCVKGAVLDVVVDIRKNSPNYGKYYKVELTADNHLQFFVPRGFAHGFVALEDDTIFQYKCDNLYNKESEGAVAYNDPDIGIEWPNIIEEFIVSDKDKLNKRLKDIENPF